MERGEEHFRDRLFVKRIDEDAVRRWKRRILRMVEQTQEPLRERGLARAAETDERADAAAIFTPPRSDTIELRTLLIGARGLQPMDEGHVGHEAPPNDETRRAIAPTISWTWICAFMSSRLNEGSMFNPRPQM